MTALCVVLFQPVQAVAIACNHYQHHINVFNMRGLNRAPHLDPSFAREVFP
ncbi:MAG TPA: hypothetical protein VGS07_32260 [Thermoanaerobaculia bacterium]|nr:hypothetical protein [Thermoanaerobaculia bacterium]